MKPERSVLSIFAAVGFLLFVGSLSFSTPEFRAWEILSRDDWTFEPNKQIRMEEIGDLGYKRWVRALQDPRHNTFSTDAYGFRNPIAMERPDVLLVGDSFVVGSGLSDDETLSQRLAAETGLGVYNYGMASHAAPAFMLTDPRWVRWPPKVVIYAPAARVMQPRTLFFPEGRWPAYEPDEPQKSAFHAVERAISKLLGTLNRDNGLTIAARYGFNGLRHHLFGSKDTLQIEGKTVLVLSLEAQELTRPVSDRGALSFAEMLRALSRELGSRGIGFIFAPIPESGTIYEDFYPARERALVVRPSMLDVVLERAALDGLNTVDLRPVFTENRLPYLFQRDDTHFNVRATTLAAKSLHQALDRLAGR